MKSRQNKVVAAVGAVIASAVCVAAMAVEPPSCIVSGWPAEDPSYSDYSDEVALDLGAHEESASSEELEARFRTWEASAGVDLNTTEARGLFIYIR